LTAVVNGTVTASPGDWGGRGVETPGDVTGSGSTQNFTFDYVRFYVLFSDLTKEKVYEVSYNQTVDLGKDSAGTTDSLSDTLMSNVPEEDLIFYLTSVLSSDFQNFTITLGMRIWCEDNFISDRDNWNSLLIKSCDFNFTYQKKVNQFTKISWNQIGNTITGDNVEITGGNLRFQYKIDQDWPISLSPNSEIQVLINGNPLLETFKLSTASTEFQEARSGGLDVKNSLLKDVNISVSILVFMGDNFPLAQNYTISITDVFLRISYIRTTVDLIDEPWFFTGLFILTAAGVAVLTGLLIAYIKIWRFPIPIRKVRKYEKTLDSEKVPDVPIIKRNMAFKRIFQNETKNSSKFFRSSTPPSEKSTGKKIIEK
jgi:hypothetical protein